MDIGSAQELSGYEFRDSAIPVQDDHAQEQEHQSLQIQAKSQRWPASPETGPENKKYKAAWIGMRTVLKNYHGMFMVRKSVTQSCLDACGAFIKLEIKRTGKDAGHRVYLANSGDLWTILTDVFTIGTRVLRMQSFPDASTYDQHHCSFSNFMASNHGVLIKDIERLNDLLSLSRNMLVSTRIAQEAAASAKFDQKVLEVIDACIRVTARGYDGEPANTTETKWATIIAAYKKLTMTALQWLHCFVSHNEQRKLHLFNQLFGDFQVPDPDQMDGCSIADEAGQIQPEATSRDAVTDSTNDKQFVEAPALKVMDEIIRSVQGYCQQTMRHIPSYPGDFPPAQYGQFLRSVVNSLKDKYQNGLCGENVPNFASLPVAYFRKAQTEAMPDDPVQVAGPDQARRIILDAKDKVLSEFLYQMASTDREWDSVGPGALNGSGNGPVAAMPPPAPLSQSRPGSAASIDDNVTEEDEVEGDEVDEGDGDEEEDDEDEEEEEEEEEEDEEEEEEDDEEDDDDSEDEIGSASRGLLTDIPLVLGPNEIEALPLMIESSIRSTADPRDTSEEVHAMQALRCYRMISVSAGRNLLRELLIFIAAWDLQDGDPYFRNMTNIMETLLAYGLMPYAFNSFSEDKDVISPAQSILIKILTNMFRKRQAETLADPRNARPSAFFPAPPDVEATIVRYIFMVFRTHIIPQTCALIYLQGQIRLGKVLPEDFPLNLWDMERVYEGVYQFLEFFAVLTETEAWKALLVEEEIVFELITLLRELDESIPKSVELQPSIGMTAETSYAGESQETQGKAPLARPEDDLDDSAPAQLAAAPVAVERPYDPSPASASTTNEHTITHPDDDDDQDNNQSDTASAMMENNIEPADFEWRNLKKLVVLVLSSLVWRSHRVQDQIRAHDGVEMIYNCCNADGNNPYIKDHAVMCLRFLVEGNPENQQIVREIEERRAAERQVREPRSRTRPTRVPAEGNS